MKNDPTEALSNWLDVFVPHRERHNRNTAIEIVAMLDAAGFVIAPKQPSVEMMQAGVIAWRRKHDSQVYAEPLAEACYQAMIKNARR